MPNHTSRIVLPAPCGAQCVIYTENSIITELKKQELIIQLGQKHFPAKGESDNVEAILADIARKRPDRFSKSSVRQLTQRNG